MNSYACLPKNAWCIPPAVVIMTTADEMHPAFSGRHPKLSYNFRSLPTSHGDCRGPLYPCYVKCYHLHWCLNGYVILGTVKGVWYLNFFIKSWKGGHFFAIISRSHTAGCSIYGFVWNITWLAFHVDPDHIIHVRTVWSGFILFAQTWNSRNSIWLRI